MEIIVENEYFHIGKRIRVGIGKADLMNLARELNLGDYRIETRTEEEFLFRELIFFDSAGLLLFIEFGKVAAIRICPLRNKEGLIIWPELEEFRNS